MICSVRSLRDARPSKSSLHFQMDIVNFQIWASMGSSLRSKLNTNVYGWFVWFAEQFMHKRCSGQGKPRSRKCEVDALNMLQTI